ncbi:MAG: siroheme synthase, partial [Deltaproteobacteria bacterium HGW-Deltaproteobacteria-21]
SILRRGDLVIAVSTSGKSPALARRLREQLEGMFGEEYGAYVRLLGKARENVLSGDFPSERKGEILRELIDSDLLDAIRLGDRSRVASTLERILRTELNEEIREIIQNI